MSVMKCVLQISFPLTAHVCAFHSPRIHCHYRISLRRHNRCERDCGLQRPQYARTSSKHTFIEHIPMRADSLPTFSIPWRPFSSVLRGHESSPYEPLHTCSLIGFCRDVPCTTWTIFHFTLRNDICHNLFFSLLFAPRKVAQLRLLSSRPYWVQSYCKWAA